MHDCCTQKYTHSQSHKFIRFSRLHYLLRVFRFETVHTDILVASTAFGFAHMLLRLQFAALAFLQLVLPAYAPFCTAPITCVAPSFNALSKTSCKHTHNCVSINIHGQIDPTHFVCRQNQMSNSATNNVQQFICPMDISDPNGQMSDRTKITEKVQRHLFAGHMDGHLHVQRQVHWTFFAADFRFFPAGHPDWTFTTYRVNYSTVPGSG